MASKYPTAEEVEQSQCSDINNNDNISDNNNNNNNNLRQIFIDASNVARFHGQSQGGVFSCKGIKIVVDYFLKRGHKVEAYVPRYRRGNTNRQCRTINPEFLDELDKAGILKYCPNKSYDDRFIVEAAVHHEGIIVSNDQYRDILKEHPDYRRKLRLLEYVFSGDLFMPAQDPLGKTGPRLDEYLSFKPLNKQIQSTHQIIPQINNLNIPNTSIVHQLRLDNDKKKHYDSLNEMFPKEQTEIREILNEYPSECCLDFLIEKLLNKICDKNKPEDIKKNLNETKINIENTIKTNDEQQMLIYSKTLYEMFPNNKIEIREILTLYSSGYSLDFLIEKLLNKIGDESMISSDISNKKNDTELNINNNNNQSNQSKKPKIQRDPFEKAELYENLKNLFPNNKSEIEQVLDEYPLEKDLEILSGKIIDIHDIECKIYNENLQEILISEKNPELFFPERLADETNKLYQNLIKLFPNNSNEINEILKRYPTQYDLDYLTDKLLQLIY